ncbi:tRNA lysidine(34) synthetase TilS [Ideonella sp. 3Y2]|uniref:tRNA(Ile)-lysidine synthase n=1 Tax=Ideonella alba TaxID=2824118 RepID=A0A941BGW9_9BURK|nr:tRNA lysidine(34) synthetase TilS [Ideonella alba]
MRCARCPTCRCPSCWNAATNASSPTAASPTPPTAEGRPACVAVALSGGRDSTALCHATVRAARALGLTVVALHVHHGLQAEADDWVRHLERQCRRWQRAGWPLRLRVARLTDRPPAGASIEAWARQRRHQALGRMAAEEGATLLLLAHHARDQAETVCLQALRGAGPAGLAAMPRSVVRDGLTWARPWLGCSPQAIEHYVRRHRLGHIEDPSNRDPRFERNRLRLQVWPALVQAFPATEQALVDVARQAWEAAELIDEIAAADLEAVRRAPHGLALAAWLALSPARRRASLRRWLKEQGAGHASDRFVDRLLAELPQTRIGRWPVDGPLELRLYRGTLSLSRRSSASITATDAPVWPVAIDHRWRPLPAGQGWVRLRPVEEGGLPCSRLAGSHWQARQGGERFALGPGRPARSLKKQFQTLGIPAWQRQGPLLWSGAQLLWVPGLGVEAQARAAAGEPQLSLEWSADEPDAAAQQLE